ncbi:MAG: DUF1015 domain-containing protein [Phycisphaerae bacterium]|nr:DUF1015 domain-containing protein [Phycisphaerae bacterium]
MAEIRPFEAIRYDYNAVGGDLSARIAPPYDVLDQTEKDELLAKSDRNIVAIDLPHIPPKSLGPQEVYERSARTLQAWLDDGTLVREAEPALYVYHQVFEQAGRAYTRRKFIARLRLVPFSEGVVLPHEETFGGPKEDRLALMKTTACNLSPVFGLYTDPQDAVGQAFESTVAKKPNMHATLKEVENRVWIVTDPEIIERVCAVLADKRVFIADGHHRYGTALNYRDYVAEQSGGTLDPQHPANFVMMVLGSMDDPGSLIIPYYRALVGEGLTLETLKAVWAEGTTACTESEADVVLYEGNSSQTLPLKYTKRQVLSQLAEGKSDAWKALDYAYLHRYLIDELLAKKFGSGYSIEYAKSREQTESIARQHNGIGLLVKATPMPHLRAVSEAGDLMPQKSTYFYPKLATGFTINPLS